MGRSAAVVVSSTRATSGVTEKAAPKAPRVPTSSCAVKAKVTSMGSFSRSSSSITAQPTRSSMALALNRPSPKRSGGPTKAPQVPSGTMERASSRLDAPMSRYRASVLGTFFMSSRLSRWMAFIPMTPGTRPGPSSTGLPRATRRSTPPTKSNFKKPSSVARVTMTPTSSMWAHSISRFSAAFRPRLNTMRLPRASVRTLSACSSAQPRI